MYTISNIYTDNVHEIGSLFFTIKD
jgi:hypothetical protein